jgi:hypothetical protein
MIDFEVKDHKSKIIHLIPNHLREPVAFIAKIRGFESVDEYAVQLVKDDLEMIRKDGEGIVATKKFGECIADYLQNMIPKQEYTTTTKEEEEEEDKRET